MKRVRYTALAAVLAVMMCLSACSGTDVPAGTDGSAGTGAPAGESGGAAQAAQATQTKQYVLISTLDNTTKGTIEVQLAADGTPLQARMPSTWDENLYQYALCTYDEQGRPLTGFELMPEFSPGSVDDNTGVYCPDGCLYEVGYTYDENGNVTKKTYSTREMMEGDENSVAQEARYYTYQYDESGNVSQREFFWAGDETPYITEIYLYDGQGRLAQIMRDYSSGIMAGTSDMDVYEYDENGHLKSAWLNLTDGGASYVPAEYTCDEQGRVIRYGRISSYDGRPLNIFEYEYGEDGQLVSLYYGAADRTQGGTLITEAR